MRATSRPRNPTPVPFRSPALTAWGVWDRFLRTRADAGFMQSSWWARSRANAGARLFGTVVRRRGMITGGAVVHRTEWRPGEGYYVLPDGPVLPEDPGRAREAFDAILDLVRRHRFADTADISHVRMAPRWVELPEFLTEFDIVPAPDEEGIPPRHTIYVDLRASETGILAQMPAKGRYSIAVARRHELSVVADPGPRGIDDLLSLSHTLPVGDRSPPLLAAELASALPALSNSGDATLLFAQRGDERLAAALVVYFGVRGTSLFSVSSEADRDLMAPYLLQFEAMRHAKAHGCESYDLWGIAPAEWKLRLGGDHVALVPAFDLVFDRSAYARYLGEPSGPMTGPPEGMYVE